MSGGYRFDLAEFRARAASRLLAAAAPPTRGDDDLNPEARAIPQDQPPRDAAVLVPIVAREPELTVLLTQRTAELRSHSGQIAFPGGRIDADDDGPVDAALREAEEETGIGRTFVEPVGFLDGYHTRTNFSVVPVVGIVLPGFALRPEPGEVAAVFEVPLRFLMTAENHARHSRDWKGKTRHFHALPWCERYIWGATAGMIINLYDRLYAAP